MERVGGYLQLKIDIAEPVEVRDLGVILNSMAEQYDDFVLATYGEQETDARFYINEIGQGCIFVNFAAATIGMMDQVIILKQFYETTKLYIDGLLGGGSTLPPLAEKEAGHIVDMVRSVAASDNGSLRLAYKEAAPDGSERSLVITKQEAREIVEKVGRLSPEPKVALPLDDLEASKPRRVLMRLYQHNQDPRVASKERTGHKAVVKDIDDKPKTLTYETELLADELADIVAGKDYSQIVFDVTLEAVREGASLKSYRLIEIHNWFLDEEVE
jgi:hypothetical protein